jgi:hypothetical protein
VLIVERKLQSYKYIEAFTKMKVLSDEAVKFLGILYVCPKKFTRRESPDDEDLASSIAD